MNCVVRMLEFNDCGYSPVHGFTVVAILKQKQNIGTFCSIVYLRERFHNTENKYGVQMQHRTVKNSF